MRNVHSLFAVAIALAAVASVVTAAPRTDKTHGPGAAVGQGANFGAAAGAAAPDPLFAILDTDGDGVISSAEMRKAVAALKSLDNNKDGNITWEEVLAHSSTVGQVGFGPSDSGAGLGAGGGIGDGASQAMGRFMQFDKNHDGKVTVDEVPATMRDWDQNHDGVIDARELEIAARRLGDRATAVLGRGLGGQQGPGMKGQFPGGNSNGAATGAKSP